MRRSWGSGALWALGSVLVCSLPFARGLLRGESFYFRDLAIYFFPVRRFLVEGLLQWEARFWNPFVHEGVSSALPPLGYPVDLLQVLWPDERGFSLLLALHVPLGALGLSSLARRLGASPLAAAAGGVVFALGGFGLSCLNLYVHLQAAAWAPWIVGGLLQAGAGGRREVVRAAVLTALGLSTTGVELVAQAVVLAAILAAAAPRPSAWARLGGAVGLGGALASVPLLLARDLTEGSERAAGFPADVVLSYSIHPLSFLQVVVGNWHGDLMDLVNTYWGTNFYPGYPYFLSLYLGVTVVVLAAVGAWTGPGPRRSLALAALAAAVLCLGPYAGLGSLVDALPALRGFRYPSKAFFTVHLCASLLAALGLEALARGGRRHWLSFAIPTFAAGVLLAGAPLVPAAAPDLSAWFAAGFFPPHYPLEVRMDRLGLLAQDAARGGVVALAAGAVGLLAARRSLSRARAGSLLAALLAADLLRTGAGLNPTVSPSFFRVSEGIEAVVDRLRAEGGRVFTCDVWTSPSYFWARQLRHGRHELWSLATVVDTLTPYTNVDLRLPTAYGLDLTMLVPQSRILYIQESSCGPHFPEIASRLRRAGVHHVLSLDPLDHPDLGLVTRVAPPRLAPLTVHVYALARPLPLRAVARNVVPDGGPAGTPRVPEDALAEGAVVVEGAGPPTTNAEGRILSTRETSQRIEVDVTADRETFLILREGYAPGWTATVDGQARPVLRADARHRAVPVGPGTSRVVVSYRPPHLRAGASLTVIAFLLSLGVWLWPPGRGTSG